MLFFGLGRMVESWSNTIDLGSVALVASQVQILLLPLFFFFVFYGFFCYGSMVLYNIKINNIIGILNLRLNISLNRQQTTEN